jgi:protein-tyrosine phosphatase
VAFRVLFVCTGNVCRSPIAAELFRMRLPPDMPLTVDSAGTMALAGWAMDGPSARALRELGGDPHGHLARQLTEAMVSDSDLILTAATAHRSAILQADPLAFRRVFTVREFARLGTRLGPLAEAPSEQALRERVRAVAEERGVAGSSEDGGDDIGDPFGGNVKLARQCAAMLAEAVEAVVVSLGGSAVRAGARPSR